MFLPLHSVLAFAEEVFNLKVQPMVNDILNDVMTQRHDDFVKYFWTVMFCCPIWNPDCFFTQSRTHFRCWWFLKLQRCCKSCRFSFPEIATKPGGEWNKSQRTKLGAAFATNNSSFPALEWKTTGFALVSMKMSKVCLVVLYFSFLQWNLISFVSKKKKNVKSCRGNDLYVPYSSVNEYLQVIYDKLNHCLGLCLPFVRTELIGQSFRNCYRILWL